MKKLMLLAAAAATLAACTSEEEVFTGKPQEITLSAVNKKATRGIVESTELKVGNDYLDMHVYASYYDGTIHEGFFNNNEETFVYRTSDKVWAPANDKHYFYPISPANDHMDFMAYAYSLTEGNTATATWASSESDWTQLTEASSEPIVTLNFTKELDGKEEVLYSTPYIGDPTKFPPTEIPELEFHHPQAWIEFIIKADKQSTAEVLKIRNVEINKILCTKSAKINMTSTTTSSGGSGSKVEYGSKFTFITEKTNDGGGEKDKTVNKFVIGEAKKEGESLSVLGWNTTDDVSNVKKGDLLIVPMEKTGFTIDYIIEQGGSSDPATDLSYKYEADSNAGAWEAGHKYVYEITIGLNEILLKAKVDNWDEEEYTVKVPEGTVTKKTTTPSSAPARK